MKGIMAVAIALVVSELSYAQTPAAGADCEARATKPARTDLQKTQERQLSELMACRGASTAEYSACNIFTGRALERLFGLSDFKNGNNYLLANEIAQRLAGNQIAGWKPLGPASEQATLDKAASAANGGRPVVGVKASGEGAGHVVMILAGAQEAAPDWSKPGLASPWKGLRSPNAASFFLNNAKQSFVGCPLHEVWAKGPTGVLVYYKP